MADEAEIAGLGTRKDHLAVSPRLDPTKLQLSAEEAAVLAAIGKVRQLGELLDELGLDENKAISTLLGLRARGLVVKARLHRPKAPEVSAALNEQVALSQTVKVQILELEGKLETADYFGLLGIAPGADAAAAKAAFYKLARRLHPDRYFGRELGSYRGRLDRVFAALSYAHKTLTDPVKREEYLAARVGAPPGRRTPSEPPAAARPSAPAAPPPAPAAGAERTAVVQTTPTSTAVTDRQAWAAAAAFVASVSEPANSKVSAPPGAPKRAPMKRMSWRQQDFPIAPVDPRPKSGK